MHLTLDELPAHVAQLHARMAELEKINLCQSAGIGPGVRDELRALGYAIAAAEHSLTALTAAWAGPGASLCRQSESKPGGDDRLSSENLGTCHPGVKVRSLMRNRPISR